MKLIFKGFGVAPILQALGCARTRNLQ